MGEVTPGKKSAGMFEVTAKAIHRIGEFLKTEERESAIRIILAGAV